MRLALIASLLLVLAAPAAPQARRQRPAASAAAQHSLEEDQKALNELQRRDIDANIAVDVDKLMSLYTDDVVYLVPGRAPLVGQEAVRKYLDDVHRQLADWDMLGYEEKWQEARVVGDYAFEWGTVDVRAKKGGERNESAATRNAMQILHRESDGSWKIARVIWNLQAAPSQQNPSPQTPAQPPQKPKE